MVVERWVRRTVALAVFQVVVALPAIAGPCDKVLNEEALTACLNNELNIADKELNRVYSTFKVKLEEANRERLRKTQLVWIRSRDSDCEFEAESVGSGSAYQAVNLSCLIKKTRQRTKQLEEWKKIF